MKKLFLLSLLFAYSWLAQASEAKHEIEQKQVAQRAQAVIAASGANAVSQAASEVLSDEERAKQRMVEIQRQHKEAADRAMRHSTSGGALPVDQARSVVGAANVIAPHSNNARRLMVAIDPHAGARAHRSRRNAHLTWKEIGDVSLYFAYPLVLAFGNGIANNVSARYAGLEVKRWRSYKAPWWEFIFGAVFKTLQLGWAETFFESIGVNEDPLRARLLVKFFLHGALLQPIIGLFQELGESIPLGKFGPGWRSNSKIIPDSWDDFYKNNLSLQIGAATWMVFVPLFSLAIKNYIRSIRR